MSNRSGNAYAITVIAPLRRGFFATFFWRFWLAGIVFPQVRRTVWMMQLPLLTPWPKASQWVKRNVIGGWWLPLIVAGVLAFFAGRDAGADTTWAIILFTVVLLVGFPVVVKGFVVTLVLFLGRIGLGWFFAEVTQRLALMDAGQGSEVMAAAVTVVPYAFAALIMGIFLLLLFWPSTRYQQYLYELGFLHSGQWFIVRPKDLTSETAMQRARRSLMASLSRFDIRRNRRTPEPQPHHVARWSLWFSANFNGPWDPYIEAFSNFIPGGLNLLYRPIDGFPMASPFYPFNRWIRFNQHTATHYYSRYGLQTTKDIRGALTFAGAVREFVAAKRVWGETLLHVRNESQMWADFDRLVRVFHRDPVKLDKRDIPRSQKEEPAFPRVTEGGLWKGGLRRRNQSGQAYCLNVITEIASGDRHNLEALLSSLSNGASPFAQLRRVHNARFVVVADVKHQGRPTLGKRLVFPFARPLGLQAFSNCPLPTKEDYLSGPRLFFSCTFDGAMHAKDRPEDGGLRSFLNQLWDLPAPWNNGVLVNAIWGSARIPGGRNFANEDEFARHIMQHQIHNSTFFLDSPNPTSNRTFTVEEIEAAVEFQNQFFVSFLHRIQRYSPETAGRYVNALAWLLEGIEQTRSGKRLEGRALSREDDIGEFLRLVHRTPEPSNGDIEGFFGIGLPIGAD